MKRLEADLNDLRRWTEASFSLPSWSIHGPTHWDRVRDNGLELAEDTPGADKRIIRLFALLHDCRRESDSFDPKHGKRAALEARNLRGNLIILEDDDFDLLYVALRDHSSGQISDNPTIACCWDADRLDLPRVGIRISPRFLSTEAAKLKL